MRHFPDELGGPRAARASRTSRERGLHPDNGIDCDLEGTGDLTVADQPYQVDELRAWVDEAAARGEELVFLDRDAVQAEVHSPLWLAGALPAGPGRDALLDPAKLSAGSPGSRPSAASRSTRARGSSRSSGGRAASVVRTASGASLARRPRRRGDVGLLGLAAAPRARSSCRSTTTSWCRSR